MPEVASLDVIPLARPKGYELAFVLKRNGAEVERKFVVDASARDSAEFHQNIERLLLAPEADNPHFPSAEMQVEIKRWLTSQRGKP